VCARLCRRQAFTAKSFEDEEEHSSKRTRELIPIDYTDEERLAGMSVHDKVPIATQLVLRTSNHLNRLRTLWARSTLL
jgi:hypothetical protein